MKVCFLLFIFLAFTISLNSQEFSDDKNHTDANGWKQGPWERKYPDGTTQYRGVFKDNHPVGEFIRYFPNGNRMALMNFCNDGVRAETTLYYEDGTLAAQGVYTDEKKDSIWRYFSYYDNRLAGIETYNKGVRDGISCVYYDNGNISESFWYENGARNGPWRQYYENGRLRMETFFEDDQRQGIFLFYSLSGDLMIRGKYQNNRMHDEWTYFDESGKIASIINYIEGTPENQDELIEKEQDLFRTIEQMRGRIPEPDESELFYPRR
jgi:antitoxin component YwqK of YwqJK toxin-antitoxin module